MNTSLFFFVSFVSIFCAQTFLDLWEQLIEHTFTKQEFVNRNMNKVSMKHEASNVFNDGTMAVLASPNL